MRIAEEKAFLGLRRELSSARIFYRHRPENTARKSGNIEDWVRRFGANYDGMIILDADSLMTGDTIVRLVAAMETHPDVALIQTLPLVVNARTLFARLQQLTVLRARRSRDAFIHESAADIVRAGG